MIQIPRWLIRQIRNVLRLTFGRNHSPVHLQANRDGLIVHAAHERISVVHQQAGSFGMGQLLLPYQAFQDMESKSNDSVSLDKCSASRAVATWNDNGVPRIAEYESLSADSYTERPATPSRMSAKDANLLNALDDAMQTASSDAVRYATQKIQLRGKEGVIAATDGLQLLWQSGFNFPWTGDLLLPRVNVFRSRELDGEVGIGATDQYVCVKVGSWSFFLPIDKEGRFPRVESIIPDAASSSTRLELAMDDVLFLVKALPRLPGKSDEKSPVTLDLNGQVSVRAREQGQERSTEVVLTSAHTSGKSVRMAMSRIALGRALDLGFKKAYIQSADQPILFEDERRKYVFVPLGKEAALAPSANDMRQLSAPVATDSHQQPTPSPERKNERMRLRPPPQAIQVNGNGQSNGHSPSQGIAASEPSQPQQVGFAALMEEAQSVQNGLRDLLLRSNRLLAGLKAYRRHAKTMQSTLASLRQLQQVQA